MPEQDELDRLIDSELARYGEPRAGLEQRIFARIAGGAERSAGQRRLLLALAAPLAASLLIFVYVMQRMPAPQAIQVAAPPATVQSAPRESNPTEHPSSKFVSRTYKHKRSTMRFPEKARLNLAERPKLDTFPTLQPPSDSERTIIRFAAEASETERNTFVAPNEEFTEPIRITALHIPPLPSPGEDTN